MIGKFALFLVLALCAIQSQTAHIPHDHPEQKTELDDILKKIEELVNKIKEIIGKVTDLPSFLKEIEEKIKEIIGGNSIDDIINKIKDAIANAAGGGEHAKECVDAQKDAIDKVAQDAKAGAQACVDGAKAKVESVKKQIADLTEAANALKTDIAARVQKCIKDNHLNPIGLLKCLKDQIEPAKKEIEEMEQKVVALVESCKQIAVDAAKELEACVANVKTSTDAAVQGIIADVKKCMDESKSTTVSSFRRVPYPEDKTALDDILKKIEELVNKIKDIIGKLTGGLPGLLKDIEEKIKQIASGLNLDEIVKKIKDTIANAAGGGEHAKECVDAQKEAIDKVAQDAKAGAQACVDAAQAKVQSVKDQIANLTQAAGALKTDIEARVQKCIKDNHLNPIGLLKCLKDQVEPIKKEVEEIEQKVVALTASCAQVATETTKELQACVTNVKASTDASVKEIIANVKKCVEESESTTVSSFHRVQYPEDKTALDDILKKIQELVNKIKDIIGKLTGGLPGLLKDIEEKIKQIASGLNLDEIVNKIKDTIANAAGGGEHAKECVDAQKDAIDKVAQDAKAGAQACVDAAQAKVQSVKDQIANLTQAAGVLKTDIEARVQKCIKDNHLNPIGLLKCLKDQVEPIKKEVEEIEQKVVALTASCAQVATETTKELQACVSNVKASTDASVKDIVAKVKECMEEEVSTTVSSVYRSRRHEKTDLDDILKKIQEFISKIKEIVGKLTGDLPALIKEIEDKIKQIVSGLNITEILQKIKDTIANAVGTGALAKQCVEAQKDAIQKVAKDAENESQACVKTAESKILSLKNQVGTLIEKANNLRLDVEARAQQCIKDNHLNPVGLVTCLRDMVEPINKDIQALEAEIEALIKTGQLVLKQTVADLQTCISGVETKTATSVQNIIAEIKKCMNSAS